MPQFRPLSETKFINDANLVSYWKLDGNSNDSVGSNNGTDTNVSYVDGKYGQAVNTTGADISQVLFTNMPAISSAYTISMLFNAETLPATGYRTLLSSRTATAEYTTDIQVGLTKFAIDTGNGSSWLGNNEINYSVSTSTWYSLILTVTTSGIILYINGNRVGSASFSGTPLLVSSGQNLAIGYNPRFSGNGFDGSIDDVAIFNRALSASEVNELYQGMTLGEYLGSGSATTKLLLHLNGNSTDSSGNGNNGTDTAITYSQANGKFGQGAGFNGSSSKIDCGNVNSFTGDFTMSVWSKRGAAGEMYFISKVSANGTDQNLHFGFTNNNYLLLGFYSDDLTYSTTDSETGVWHNYIATYNYTAKTKTLYKDGKYLTSANGSGNPNFGTASLVLGYNSGLTKWFNGSIDEVIIENRAWSASEVKKYYTQSRGFFATL